VRVYEGLDRVVPGGAVAGFQADDLCGPPARVGTDPPPDHEHPVLSQWRTVLLQCHTALSDPQLLRATRCAVSTTLAAAAAAAAAEWERSACPLLARDDVIMQLCFTSDRDARRTLILTHMQGLENLLCLVYGAAFTDADPAWCMQSPRQMLRDIANDATALPCQLALFFFATAKEMALHQFLVGIRDDGSPQSAPHVSLPRYRAWQPKLALATDKFLVQMPPFCSVEQYVAMCAYYYVTAGDAESAGRRAGDAPQTSRP